MLDTIKAHYISIRSEQTRAADTVKALGTAVAVAERHIAALATGLFEDEKAKLDAWLKENNITPVAAKKSEF